MRANIKTTRDMIREKLFAAAKRGIIASYLIGGLGASQEMATVYYRNGGEVNLYQDLVTNKYIVYEYYIDADGKQKCVTYGAYDTCGKAVGSMLRGCREQGRVAGRSHVA